MIKLLKKVVIVNLLAGCIFSSAHAINLRQALESAYRTNEDLKKAQVEFMNTLEQFSQAQSNFLPDVSAQYGVTNSKTTPDSIPNGSSNLRQTQKGITLRQNLFNGGGDMASLKSAQLSFKAAKFNLYDQEGRTFLRIIAGYLEYIQAKKIYDISDVSVQFYQKQFDTVSAKLAIGEATQTELAVAEAGLYKGISDRAQNQSDLEAAKATFKQLVGIEVDYLDAAEIVNAPENLAEFSNKAKKQNFAILAAKNALEAAKAGVLVRAGELLPSLDARVETTNTSWTASGASQPSSPPGKNFSTGLTLTIPIFVKGGGTYNTDNISSISNGPGLYLNRGNANNSK